MVAASNYRYRLYRDVAPMLVTRPVLFIGLNPGADDDDAATTRMAGFTMRWGYSSFMVGNVFAHRGKLPPLRRVACGTDNHIHLRDMLKACAFVVPCWGDRYAVSRGLRVQLEVVRCALMLYDVPTRVFGLTAHGDPMSVCAAPYDTQLQEWEI